LGRYFLLTVIDKYVLRQVAKPLIASLAIGLLVLLAERLVRILDATLGKKNSFGVVFELLAYLVPHYLGTAVPAALFLGLLFGFNQLSKNHEIDGMMAAGVGLHRLLRPALFLALLFSIASLAIFGWMQPHTRYAYRSVVFDIKNVDAFYLAEEGVFMQSGGRTFILDKLDRSNNAFERIFVFDYNGPNGSETLTASSGKLLTVEVQTRPILRLNDGHRLLIERWPTLSRNGDEVPSSVAQFDQTDTPLGKVSKDLFRPRGDDERELTLPELYALQDTPPEGSTKSAMRAELHRRVINIVAMLLLPVLAIPFAIGRARSPRAYRIASALLLLVAFHEVIEQGAVAAKIGSASPWLSIWLPMLLLAIFAFWRFWRTSFSIPGEGLDWFFVPISDWTSRMFGKLRAKFGFGGAA
jgi:lipopolysaccharide export system permease protein